MAVFDAADEIGDLVLEALKVDVGRFQDDGRFRIFGERQQQMFDRDFGMSLRSRIGRGALQRRGQEGGHRDAGKVVGNHSRGPVFWIFILLALCARCEMVCHCDTPRAANLLLGS